MTEVVANALNTPTSTLTSGITSGSSSLPVAAPTSPDAWPTTGTFRVLIDLELITVTAASGGATSLTVVNRGVEGTTAASHVSGSNVELVLTAAALAALTAASGAPAAPSLTLSTANSIGTSTSFVASDATVAVFNLLGPVAQAFGDTSLTGSAAFAARQDHRHPMPATPVTSVNKTGSSAITGSVTLSQGTNVTITQSGSDLSIAAAGSGSLIGSVALVYRYTVTGTDKASIDTGVDTADAGSNDWTNGDLLEVFAVIRTDNAAAITTSNVTVNNISTGTYDRELLRATNATVLATSSLADAGWIFQTHGSGGSADRPGFMSLVIPDYAGTVFNKIAMLETRAVDATAGNNFLESWAMGNRDTTAITRLKLAAPGTDKLKVGTQLLIYKRLAS